MSALVLAILTTGLAFPEASTEFLRESAPRIGSRSSVSFFVDPDGSVLECEILYPPMSSEDQRRHCEDAIGQNVGVPARDPEGNPVHGILDIFSIRRRGSSPSPPDERVLSAMREDDMEIFVSQSPGGAERRELQLMVYIND